MIPWKENIHRESKVTVVERSNMLLMSVSSAEFRSSTRNHTAVWNKTWLATSSLPTGFGRTLAKLHGTKNTTCGIDAFWNDWQKAPHTHVHYTAAEVYKYIKLRASSNYLKLKTGVWRFHNCGAVPSVAVCVESGRASLWLTVGVIALSTEENADAAGPCENRPHPSSPRWPRPLWATDPTGWVAGVGRRIPALYRYPSLTEPDGTIRRAARLQISPGQDFFFFFRKDFIVAYRWTTRTGRFSAQHIQRPSGNKTLENSKKKRKRERERRHKKDIIYTSCHK